MEELEFDISSILTGEEAETLFDENNLNEQPSEEDTTSTEKETKPADEETSTQEEVSVEENNGTESNAVHPKGDGSSPNPYSSIARALKEDGIFSDTEDSEIEGIKGPEDFAELFEKVIDAKLDERQKRINSALNSGVESDTVQKYEQTMQYLDSIDNESIEAESEDAENLRRQLMFNDLINKGFSEDKARRSIENSFKSGSDIEDAKDALDGLKKFYGEGYKKLLSDSKAKAEAQKAAAKEQSERFRKMVVEDEVKVGGVVLDKRTKQQIFDAVSKPSYRDSETGQYFTAVQKFQKDNPLEFLKQLGIWYVLTDGGKNIDRLIKAKVQEEKNKGIRELEHKINTTSFNSDGSLRYAGGETEQKDILLSDEWKIG